MRERVPFLGKEMANDAPSPLRIGDFCGFWRASTTLAIYWARSCATTSGDNSSSNGSAALSAATSSRVFLPYADSLRLVADVTRDDVASGSGAAIIAPSTRRDRPPALSSQSKSFARSGLLAGTG